MKTYEEMMDSYIETLMLFVKFVKDSDSLADCVTELVLNGEISLEKAVNFPDILRTNLFVMSRILNRNLKEDLAQAMETYEKCVKKD